MRFESSFDFHAGFELATVWATRSRIARHPAETAIWMQQAGRPAHSKSSWRYRSDLRPGGPLRPNDLLALALAALRLRLSEPSRSAQPGENPVALHALVPGDRRQNRRQSADPQRRMQRNDDPLLRRDVGFERDVASYLMDLPIVQPRRQVLDELRPPKGRAGASSDRDELVAHEVEADAGGVLTVKVVRCNGLESVVSRSSSHVSPWRDAFGQTLGDVAAITFLAHLEDHFRHGRRVAAPRPAIKPRARVHPGPLRRPAVGSTPATRVRISNALPYITPLLSAI